MTETIHARLVTMLEDRGVPFQTLRHAPVFTSQEAAEVRGTSLASGAKALICKTGDEFQMFVVPADRRLASAAVRRQLGIRSLRFASREEVGQLTTLTPGSIPPFGSLFTLTTFCDHSLGDQDQINFNAGDHSISISMAFADYLAVESPTLGQFAE